MTILWKQPGYWLAMRGLANKSWSNFKAVGFVRREGMKFDKVCLVTVMCVHVAVSAGVSALDSWVGFVRMSGCICRTLVC